MHFLTLVLDKFSLGIDNAEKGERKPGVFPQYLHDVKCAIKMVRLRRWT